MICVSIFWISLSNLSNLFTSFFSSCHSLTWFFSLPNSFFRSEKDSLRSSFFSGLELDQRSGFLSKSSLVFGME
ncbi:MAG: hypothetical protein WCG25_08460 [bacterium]